MYYGGHAALYFSVVIAVEFPDCHGNEEGGPCDCGGLYGGTEARGGYAIQCTRFVPGMYGT